MRRAPARAEGPVQGREGTVRGPAQGGSGGDARGALRDGQGPEGGARKARPVLGRA